MKIDDAEKLLMACDIGYNYMPNELTTKSASNMKVMQYMARGVVPFVSNIGDLPSYVDFGNAGYIVNTDNVDDFVSTLSNALNDNRKNKAQNAQQKAISNFDWEVLALKFSNWFNEQSKTNFIYKNDIKDIYFVSITVPGNVGGGEIRNYFLLKKWSDLKSFSTKLFAISKKGFEYEVDKIDSELNISMNIVYKSKRTIFRILKSVFIDRMPPYMSDFKASGLGSSFYRDCKKHMPKVVHLEQVHAYYPIRKYIHWLKNNGVKIVLGCHNVEYRLLEESLGIMSFIKRIGGKLILRNLKKLEIEAVTNADVILCCSELDRDFFIKYNKNVFVVPNGVDCEYFDNKGLCKDKTLIFMGGVGYHPNADAVNYYVNEIHPLVKKRIPDVKVYLVGTDEGWLGDKKDDSIVTLGFVPDVREYLSKSRVGISPIRYGSGTRLKIMTYMASGLPVVSTSKGAEGVDYSNDKNILLRDDTQGFADAIITLLADDSLCEEIRNNGSKFVAENYDWKHIGNKLEKIYENI
jgi:glycosyltransferase involved in cell wall biosynthesis